MAIYNNLPWNNPLIMDEYVKESKNKPEFVFILGQSCWFNGSNSNRESIRFLKHVPYLEWHQQMRKPPF